LKTKGLKTLALQKTGSVGNLSATHKKEGRKWISKGTETREWSDGVLRKLEGRKSESGSILERLAGEEKNEITD